MSKESLNAEFLDAVVGSELLSEESKAALTQKVEQVTEAIRQDVKLDLASRYVADRERLVESVEFYVEEIVVGEFAELRESVESHSKLTETISSAQLMDIVDVIADTIEAHVSGGKTNLNDIVAEIEGTLQQKNIVVTDEDVAQMSDSSTLKNAVAWTIQHHTEFGELVRNAVSSTASEDGSDPAVDELLAYFGITGGEQQDTAVGRLVHDVFANILFNHMVDVISNDRGLDSAQRSVAGAQGVSESLVATIDGFINECIVSEFSELAEDLKESRRAAPDVIANAEALIESAVQAEMSELAEDISENHRLATALALAESKVEQLRDRNEQLAESAAKFERQAIMERVLRPLDGAARDKMELVLADVLTEEIESVYASNISKVIGAVVDSSQSTKSLTEGKQRPSLSTRYFGEPADSKLTESTAADSKGAVTDAFVQRQRQLAGLS